jgi:hypothetical protein
MRLLTGVSRVPFARVSSSSYSTRPEYYQIQSLTKYICRNVLNSSLIPAVEPETRSSLDFALLVRQYGSRPEWDWERSVPGFHDPPIFPQSQAIARAMQISRTHPAVIMGVIDRGPGSPSFSSDTSPISACVEPAIKRLSLQAEPSIDAILNAWELRQKQRGDSREPPPWLIVFGFLVTSDAVTIVAHFPNTGVKVHKSGPAEIETGSDIGLCSCIVDKIPFHPDILYMSGPGDGDQWKGPTADDAWISDRLRLFLALLALVTNSTLISAIWDDIDWPQEVLEAEDALEKQHAQWDLPTPTLSEDDDKNPLSLSQMIVLERALARMNLDDDSEAEGKSDAERAALEESRQRVLEWRGAILPTSE